MQLNKSLMSLALIHGKLEDARRGVCVCMSVCVFVFEYTGV